MRKTMRLPDYLFPAVFLLFVSMFATTMFVLPVDARPAESVTATEIYSTEAEALKAAAGQVEHLLVVRGAMVGAWFEMAEEAVESGVEVPSFGSILSGGHLTTSVQNKWIPSGFSLSNTFFSVSGGGILVTYVPSDEEKTLVPYARSLFPLLGGVIPLRSQSEIESELQKIAAMTVRDAMTPDPITVSPETDIDEIATLMVRRNIHTLPVQEEGILVGVIGKEDVLRTIVPNQ